MRRLLAALALALALAPAAPAPTAHARGLGLAAGPQRASAPTGLHAFLLRPDEKAARFYPRTPSFAWTPVRLKGGRYEFELGTSRAFGESTLLFTYDDIAIPALAIDHQLPWMTGVPYALWAHVRWMSKNGKVVTPWSDPFGFNMRWADSDYPQQIDAAPGMVRWKPIEGASGYEVLYPEWHPAVSFQTTTNAADEREFFTLHDTLGWGQPIKWRVRAVRFINDKDVLANGLPRVTYGPWSKTFTSVNPPKSLGVLTPAGTVSDTWDKAGQAARAHELTPGFAWLASAPVLSPPGIGPSSVGSSLYRIYLFTDDHCVNRIFTGSIVGSPAFVPRSSGGPLALPTSMKFLAKWMNGFVANGAEGKTWDGTGKGVNSNELPGSQVSAGSGGSGTAPAGAGGAAPGGSAAVDLWDSGWPTGRFYWTVVPVSVIYGPVGDPLDMPLEYQETEVPQDACETGREMSFGKVSQPVVTTGADMPYVAGLAPSGRYVAAGGKRPEVHDSPIVAWEPAAGATQYEVELSRTSYPWKAVRKLSTYGTAAVLPLKNTDAGTWFYRVRGVNPVLPAGAQKMSWSKPVAIKITGDRFVVVK